VNSTTERLVDLCACGPCAVLPGLGVHTAREVTGAVVGGVAAFDPGDGVRPAGAGFETTAVPIVVGRLLDDREVLGSASTCRSACTTSGDQALRDTPAEVLQRGTRDPRDPRLS
jgi:hypothetical protein